ncbi:MAG: hypothetical protein AVDCRST_MAG73-1820 [uncultured Thermomicrobiales bacterium]|uniref:Uncharacterized protein n=1 Tax=uncultured Thermomicrobiales bacterium TaxID=1645740 RepID=A0A6J4U4W5_9BACT|nr:MAG: hypothetical protein AVDCRST_MAG73-1820 [uncultured Thermomicrobiales bacterium]
MLDEQPSRRQPPMDLLIVATTVGFFAACIAYVVGCQRL